MNEIEELCRQVVNFIPDNAPSSSTEFNRPSFAAKTTLLFAADEIARLTAENAALHAKLEKAVILPCKCDDTLYCVRWSKYNPKGGIITEEFVHKITLNHRNNTYAIYTICNGIWIESKFVAIDFGDILFTDRAKAEARLAELKGGEGE